MHAQVGDWLVVNSATDSAHARHAEIIGVSDDGGPPFRIRWVDTGRETLMFPGPDAEVVTAEQLAERDRRQLRRAERVQAEIAARRHQA
ncbi:MAG TPA: DUF1918 domain-containing protein [Jatrophihabitans sp.]|nr:DUF1918 domain-containing protein [Jatrophihabitans sp.]